MKEERAVKLVEDTFGNSFSEERFIPFVKNFLNEIDQDNSFSLGEGEVPSSYREYIKQYKRIGQYEDPEGEILDVLSVNLKRETSPKRARTMQRNFIGWYLKSQGYSKDNALVAFYHEDVEDWRFSYVKRSYRSEKDESGKISTEEELTPPRRFSFLVGQNEPSHTAQNQIVPILENDKDNPTLSDIEKAFNVEIVTDEFFKKYRDLFLNLKDALDEVVEKDLAIKAEFEKKEVSIVDFAKKLLSQIVFLYFLQKKGWLGVERGKEWDSGSKRFLRELFDGCGDKNFFNDILEPLFYQALRYDRRADDDYYNEFNCKIPFLNGGLFDPINNYNWVTTDIYLPDDLFSNEHRTDQGDIGDGILDIFDRYNFTVKEDEPLEREVAVDPEMLGKVFENLLEVKERKSKGTYYTPREIVHYMCQESLINYLSTEFHDSIDKEDFEKLIKYGESFSEHPNVSLGSKTGALNGDEVGNKAEVPQSIRQDAVLIDLKLASIRICDPAVGSGAFVVGMMNEILGARNALTPCFRNAEERTSYNFKRDAIQNCLYGVDIDSGAVEIAKLRLWLSLVVDEQDRKEIRPLPNLNYKIIRGNSLLEVEKDLFNAGLFEELEEKKLLYFNEENATKKQQYEKRIDELISKITSENGEFDFTVYFSEVFHDLPERQGKKGFDVVIGNPPYVQLQKMKNDPVRKKYQEQKYKTYDSMGDIYCLFYEKGVEIARNEGVLCYISSNKWMRAGYGKKLRNFFLGWNPLIVIDLGSDVFETATVDTNILFVQKNLNERSLKGLTLSKKMRTLNISDKVKRESVKFSCFTDGPWFIGSETEVNLKQKIEDVGKPLKEWDISINYGIKTGYNDAFIINNETKERLIKEDPKSTELIKPVLRGRDIQRYQVNWDGLWLIDTHNGYGEISPIDINNYKAIKRHLYKFYPSLKKRQDKGITPYNLRNCAYHAEFEKDKIAWSDISKSPSFTLLPGGHYINNTSYLINSDNKYLLGILNSNVVDYYISLIATDLGKEGFRYFKQFVEKVPVPQVSESEQSHIAKIVEIILQRKISNPSADTSDLEHQVNCLVYDVYQITEEEIATILQEN